MGRYLEGITDKAGRRVVRSPMVCSWPYIRTHFDLRLRVGFESEGLGGAS